MLRLVVTAKEESRIVETAAAVVTVGRGSENAVQVHDEAASRNHCRIERLPDGSYRLADLASRNGTRLNGELVEQRELKPGDVILIGETRIIVEACSADAAAAPSAPAPSTATSSVPASSAAGPSAAATSGPIAPPPPQGPQALRLVFLSGPNQGRDYVVRTKIVSIGRRRRDNDIALFDTGISNRHAEIRHTPDGFVLVDEGSKNGTFLNGQRVKRSPLKPGDRILLGRSLIEVQAADPAAVSTATMRKPAPDELGPSPAKAPGEPPELRRIDGEEGDTAGPSSDHRRRRVALLATAIALAVVFFAGAYVVRRMSERSRRRPPPSSEAAEPAPEQKATKSIGQGHSEPAATAGSSVATTPPGKAGPVPTVKEPGDTRAAEATAQFQAALRLLRRAEMTDEPPHLDAAREALEALRTRLNGTLHGQELAMAMERLTALRQTAPSRRRDAEAALLLAAARQHRDRSEPHIARLHCQEVLTRFPDSPAAAEARAMLDALDASAAPTQEK